MFKDQEQVPSRCFFRLDVVSFDAERRFVAGRPCTALMFRPFQIYKRLCISTREMLYAKGFLLCRDDERTLAASW